MGDDDDEADTGCHRRMVEALTGGALGLFVGGLLGLSVTPGTTTAVLGGLVALLATFFGLVTTEKSAPIRPAHGRIVAFCLVGLLATLVGVYVRAHGTLGPRIPGPLESMKIDLINMGYKEEDAKKKIDELYLSKDSKVVLELPKSSPNPFPPDVGVQKKDFPTE